MRTLSKGVVGLFVVAFFLTVASSARADNFNWSYSQGGVSAGGTLTTGTLSGGQATITDLSGTVAGVYTVSGLLGAGSLNNNDNTLYYPGTPYLDGKGFAFTAIGPGPDTLTAAIFWDASIGTSGGYDFDLVGSGSAYQYYGVVGAFTLTPISAPEPGTLTLLFAGLLGLGLLAGVERYRGSGLRTQV